MKGSIFLGPPRSGKGRAVKLMYRGLKAALVNGRSPDMKHAEDFFKHRLWGIGADTDLLIIDDFPVKYFAGLVPVLLSDSLVIHHQGKPETALKPQIIVILDNASFFELPASVELFDSYNVYTCIFNHDNGISMVLHHPKEVDGAYNIPEDPSVQRKVLYTRFEDYYKA